ncbi:hypothetical protein [Rickettsiella endosymbiont of Miltochrista miniata]|uniref:hypothetical protein n=1 Tax=Rickettsiella endosymbiont of Miltochrista miniata TaxID=3066239 RepID=UPI00313AC5C7
MEKNTNYYLFTIKHILPLLYVPGLTVKVVSDIGVRVTINKEKLPKEVNIFFVYAALEKLEINPYELKLYKALSLYLKYHKPVSDAFYFSKIGFYIGWVYGFINGLYLTKLMAIFIGSLNLSLVMVLGSILGLLAGVVGIIFLAASIGSIIGWLLCKILNIYRINLKYEKKLKKAIKHSKVKNLPLRLTKKDFRYAKINCFKKYRGHNCSLSRLNSKKSDSCHLNQFLPSR